ncbi:MAG: SHOCT domain-containing protein, partial [Nitrososphaerales archaeon]
LADYIQGRRGLETLQQFGQSYRVMSALKQTNSVLLKGPEKKEVAPRAAIESQKPQGKTMAEQLQQLKQALDQGLISEHEYQIKRQQILERF